VTAKAETDASASFVRRQSDGGEHVGGFHGAGRAGSAGGTGKALEVQGDDESFTFDSREKYVRGVRCPRTVGGIAACLGNACEKATFQFIAQPRNSRGVFAEREASKFGRFAETDDAGNILRAGAESTLVMPAVEKLAEACTAAYVESADAFGGVKLMAGDCKQVDAESVDVDGDFSGRLHGIGMKEDVVLCGDTANLFEGLHSAEFVVGVHKGDQGGLRSDRIADGFGVDHAVRIDGKVSDFDGLAVASGGATFFFERLAGV